MLSCSVIIDAHPHLGKLAVLVHTHRFLPQPHSTAGWSPSFHIRPHRRKELFASLRPIRWSKSRCVGVQAPDSESRESVSRTPGGRHTLWGHTSRIASNN